MKKLLLSAVATLSMGLAGTAVAQDESGHTRYPVVLSHGFNSNSNTFYALDVALSDVGVDYIVKTDVPPFDSSTARGEALISEIEEFLAITGHSKVNIIAHSQGGLDARYVASTRPELVASVTTLASPHFGVRTADIIDGLTGPATVIISDLIDAVASLFGQNINTTGSIDSLSSRGARNFNVNHGAALRAGSCRTAPWRVQWWPFRTYKDYSVNDGQHKVGGVQYMSMAGVTDLYNFNLNDPLDRILTVTSATFWAWEDHDGLVGRCSTHLGDVIRDDYTLNHNDFVNATRGMRGLGTNDPVALFKQHARRLKSKGL